MIDFPVNTVFTEAGKDIHLYSFVVATENSGITILERNNGTVEDTVGCRDMITADHRIL